VAGALKITIRTASSVSRMTVIPAVNCNLSPWMPTTVTNVT